jgi:putative DNA primase/helicase
MNIQDIKQSVNIVEVVSRYVSLHPHAGEMRGLCCFHDEQSPSLMVNDKKQIFKCFGCGKAGDVIDFLVAYGRTFKEAINEIKDPLNIAGLSLDQAQKQVYKPKPRTLWHDAVPSQGCQDFNHYQHGAPSKKWAYHNDAGVKIGYACRFDLPGEKMVLPLTYKTDGSRSEWRWQGFDKPRPLYNLHLLKQHPDRSVLIVEGEKTADAGVRLIETAVVVTWMGGADGIKSVDLTPLYGRKIVFWPDNDHTHAYGDKHAQAGQTRPFHDQPGNKAMLTISALLGNNCPTQKWVKNPDGAPCGWDIADTEWTPDQALAYLRANLIDVPVIPETGPVIPPAAILNDLPKEKIKYDVPAPPPLIEEEDHNHKENNYFKFLGYDKSESGGHSYYFFAFTPKTVVRLSPSSMSKSNLLQLAPLNYWESYFPDRKGISLDAVQNFLINRCHDVGIFNDKWVRGRGAWLDKKDIVIHAGGNLIVNGQPTNFNKYKSKYIYEIGEQMEFDLESPIDNLASSKLIEILKLLNWERDIDAYLLAGWCVVAPICGALTWRPHIWLTGSVGTGKSWVFKELVRRLLGETALSVQGETSEAGLRQTLQHDALPVIFDEAEGADKRSQDRMQDVLGLMRSSSASDGGIMLKGSSMGHSKSYRIRSCFAFASVAVQITQQSDRTRISVLSMKKLENNNPLRAERWEKLKRMYNEVVTDDYCRGLRARTISLLPVILENSRTFSNAAAAVLGEQRTGDQIGSLLAGAYSLSSSKIISFDDAIAWVRSKDWAEEKAQEQTRDELMLINHIMQQLTRIETNTLGTQERSLGELVMFSCKWRSDICLTEDAAHDRLKRLGIKVADGFVYIANQSDYIAKVLLYTPWAKNHNKILVRVDGAFAVESTTFASGMKSRAVAIPLDKIFTA